MMRARWPLVLLALSALACASCIIHSDDDDEYYGRRTGSITLHWTINGTEDPTQCQLSGSPSIFITIFAGGSPLDYTQDCRAMATVIDLPSGSYEGDVHLMDGAGQPRTTDIHLVPFHIDEGTNLDVPIDFPADSFY